ncbi:MAG: hypothetical protein JWQ49_66 [Edaphobacter sp.]|nr:hypothetical protein [Edaphobacter sp.]
MVRFLDALRATPDPEWRASIKHTIQATSSPTPKFDVQIGSVNSYDELFAGSCSALMADSGLIQEAQNKGRVILSGRGGGAKTKILERLARRALATGSLPIFLSLESWTQAHSEMWRSSDSQLTRIDQLIQSLSNSKFGIFELDSLSPAVSRILIIDGLNEVDRGIAQELIFTLDEYASTAINTSVIVSDRLVRREFVRPERWSLYLVKPLSDSEIKKHIPKSVTLTKDEIELLRSPYFLNAYLTSGQMASTRSEEIRKWFETHAGLTSEDIVHASEAAYAVYGTSSRTFNIRKFEAIAGPTTTTKLTKSGSSVLSVDGETATFDHHLKHDFLASRHLANHPDLWNSASFNHVTFSGSSFDAIMMCVEQISQGAADLFIRAVYDWNLYGVGYALGESRRHNVSAEMVTVILSMFAEKRWDAVVPTRQRVHDSLLVLKDKNADRYLKAKSLEEVFQLVRELPVSDNSPWFIEWRNLFTLPIASSVDDGVVKVLSDRDSVKGWTTANVLKRSRLSEDQQDSLRSAITSNDPVIRWRAAHALGAFPSQENAKALLSLMKDPDQSVRYGAVRSVIELASTASDDLRGAVFKSLIEHGALLVEFSSVRDEIRRSVLIRGVRNPLGWLDLCLKLMIAVQPVDIETERDRWSRATQELINMFADTDKYSNA